jgi:hypothetical protein
MKPVDQPRAGNFPEDDMTVQLAPPIERFLGELAASELSHVVDQFRTGFSALEMESFSNWHAEQLMTALAWISEQPRPLLDRLRDICEVVEARGRVSVTVKRM